MRCSSFSISNARQRGAVLVIALMMLVVLTLLGLASMQNTILEERMAGNYRDRQIAFEAAEAALRTGEQRLSNTATFNALNWDGSDYSYEGDGTLDPFTAAGSEVTNATIIAETVAPPVHFVERLPEVDMPESSLVKGFPEIPPKIRYYRTTARGQGKTADAEVVLQSTYFR